MMKVRGRFAVAILSVCLAYLNSGSFSTAGTLMPPGEQTFFDNNGLPLSAGCVYFYVPGTITPKATYQNSTQTVSNTNPVQLDAAGRAIIYGTGTYRQVVNSTGPNASLPCSPSGAQVWDQLTASTDSSTTIYAGASAGTPNAVTVTAPAFSGTDGQIINYISTNTNTGGATINPSSFGAVQIVRDSATGPGALTGGELVATNAVSLIYDATAGTFHILSPVTWPNTSGVPVGTIISVGGFSAPTNYAFAYGQAVSRTSFSSLLSAYTLAQTGSISNGSPTITGLADTTQIGVLKPVEGIGIPASARILSCTSSACTMNMNATATRSGTMTFFAYENGDGSTTFNLPDLRGKILVARDNMGGSAANISQVTANLTTTSSSTSATVSSAAGIALGMSVVGNANVPSGTTVTAISGATLTLSQAATASQSNVSTRFSVLPDAQGLGIAGGASTSTLVTANQPPYTPSGTVTVNSLGLRTRAGSALSSNDPNSLFEGNSAGTLSNPNNAPFVAASVSFSGTPTGGTSAPFGNIPSSTIVNWAVRLTP